MKDFIENLEDAAETNLDEMTKDCPEGYFRCDCGKVVSLDNAHMASVNPYSRPICSDCLNKQLAE